MSLTVLKNHEGIDVEVGFDVDDFEQWLVNYHLQEVLSVAGSEILAHREQYEPSLQIDNAALIVRMWQYLDRIRMVVFGYDELQKHYVFAVLHYDGANYTIGEFIVVITAEDGGEPDFEEFDRMPLASQFGALGL
ncbi:MAG: hypothetical protein ABIQ04_01245 [Candidatus Saccharimonadales bacterium]